MTDLSYKNKGFIKSLLLKEPDIHLRTIYKLVKSLNTKEISNESIKQYVNKIRVLQKGGNNTTIQGYHGLHNNQNACYMNASIQYLFLNNSFKQLVSEKPDFTKFEKELELLNTLNGKSEAEKYEFYNSNINDIKMAKGIKLWNIFYYIFEALNNKNNTNVIHLEDFTLGNEINVNVFEQLFNLTLLIYKNPKNKIKNNQKNLFKYDKKQHTADEFITILVDNILYCKDNSEKEKLYIKDTLYKKCKNSTNEYESVSNETFYLQLVNDNNFSTINDIIQEYEKTKSIPDGDQYADSCKSNTNPKGIITEERSAYDVSKITYLNIFLNRTKFNLTNGQPFKSDFKITANPIIEISNQQFKLIGIIEHAGIKTGGGHYVTYNYNEGKTILFDDAQVFYLNIDNSNRGSILFLYEKTVVPIKSENLTENAKIIGYYNNKKQPNNYLCAEIYHYIIDNYTDASNPTPINPKSYKKRSDGNKNYYSIINTKIKNLNYGVYSPNLITNTNNAINLNDNNFYDKYRTIYSTNLAKRNDITGVKSYSPADIITFIDKLKNASIKNAEKYLNINFIENLPDNLSHETGFIAYIEVPENAKVINFGDFHGSFHSFLRIFERFKLLGIIQYDNTNKLIINPEYYILFCGDILDRGTYAMEILDFMLELMINSPNNIIYNRGNHEENLTYAQYGFTNEIKTKLDIKTYTDIPLNFIEFFTYLPTAVIIHYKDTGLKYIACHGCIPITWDTLDIDTLNTNNKYIILDPEIATQFRWNDLDMTLSNNFSKSERNGYKNTVFNISYNLLTQFLDRFKLKFLVRGHQDSFANTVLFGKNQYNKYGNFENGTNILNVISDNTKGKTPSQLVSNIGIIEKYKPKTGPIAQINFQNEQSINYNYKNYLESDILKDNNIKAITISTNTDYERSLFIDSFMIIFVRNSTKSSPPTSTAVPSTSTAAPPTTSIASQPPTSTATQPPTSTTSTLPTSIAAPPTTSTAAQPPTSTTAQPPTSTTSTLPTSIAAPPPTSTAAPSTSTSAPPTTSTAAPSTSTSAPPTTSTATQPPTSTTSTLPPSIAAPPPTSTAVPSTSTAAISTITAVQSTSDFSNVTINKFTKGFEKLNKSVQQITQKLATLKQKLNELKKPMAGGATQKGGADIKKDILIYKNILNIVNQEALLKDLISDTYVLLTNLWEPEKNTELKDYLNNNPNDEIQQYFINNNGRYYFSDVIFTQIIFGKLNSDVYPNSITEKNLTRYYNTKFKK